MMGEAIEESGDHLGIVEDRGPLAEAQVGRDDDAGALVEFAQQMEQQGAPRSAEAQIAKLIEDDEVGMDQATGELATSPLIFLLLLGVDQVDG